VADERRFFGRVRYHGIYDGVDVVYYGNEEKLEYDFVVSPGGDPERIALRFEGSTQIALEPAGDLVVHAGDEELRYTAPMRIRRRRRAGER